MAFDLITESDRRHATLQKGFNLRSSGNRSVIGAMPMPTRRMPRTLSGTRFSFPI
ncbi:hypothetical protein [Pseudomonas sp. MPB23]|jgi:hypothetical protein|uniref:hypothetical protein n=1 Tax=Pseudomonas sp. MPB23 TaxID=3388490 RepID=UPI003985262F